jgi:dCMP deaminase
MSCPVRPPIDEYFMRIAREISSRATCDRLHVGCVIVRDRRILSTGYNGSLSGAAHCDDVGHLMENGHCVRTVHAEANAVCQAAYNGVSLRDSTAYVTHSSCWPCFKLMANAGVRRIVYGEFYRDKRISEVALDLGIELLDLTEISAPCEGCPAPDTTSPEPA